MTSAFALLTELTASRADRTHTIHRQSYPHCTHKHPSALVLCVHIRFALQGDDALLAGKVKSFGFEAVHGMIILPCENESNHHELGVKSEVARGTYRSS